MISHRPNYHLIGEGLVAHTLAAFWPEPLAWQAPPSPLLPSRPLLLHARHVWFIQALQLSAQPIRELRLHQQGLGHIHTLSSHEWHLEAFAWMVHPAELLSKLQARIHRTSFYPSPCVHHHRLIATGKTITIPAAYEEIQGLPFHTTQHSRASAQSSLTSLHLYWGNGYTQAYLPSLQPNTYDQINTHLNHACASPSFYRRSLEEHVHLLGDSLLYIPPILASGYNSFLNLLQAYLHRPGDMQAFKTHAQQLSQIRFEQHQLYQRALTYSALRSFMLAAFSHSSIMTWLMRELIDGY